MQTSTLLTCSSLLQVSVVLFGEISLCSSHLWCAAVDVVGNLASLDESAFDVHQGIRVSDCVRFLCWMNFNTRCPGCSESGVSADSKAGVDPQLHSSSLG